MNAEGLSYALAHSNRDPAREARIHRNLAQRAYIQGQFGQLEFHVDAAKTWEQVYEQARSMGLQMAGESVLNRLVMP